MNDTRVPTTTFCDTGAITSAVSSTKWMFDHIHEHVANQSQDIRQCHLIKFCTISSSARS